MDDSSHICLSSAASQAPARLQAVTIVQECRVWHPVLTANQTWSARSKREAAFVRGGASFACSFASRSPAHLTSRHFQPQRKSLSGSFEAKGDMTHFHLLYCRNLPPPPMFGYFGICCLLVDIVCWLLFLSVLFVGLYRGYSKRMLLFVALFPLSTAERALVLPVR